MNSTRWNKGDKVLSSANTLFIWCFRSRRRGCCLSSLSTSGSGVEFLSHGHSSNNKSLFAYTCYARDIPPPPPKKKKQQQQQQNKTQKNIFKYVARTPFFCPCCDLCAVVGISTVINTSNR